MTRPKRYSPSYCRFFDPKSAKNVHSSTPNLHATIRFQVVRMAGAIDNGFEARRWGSKNAYCGRRYKGVCRSRLPAASPSPLAAVRTEIASPGIEPGDFLASQRKPRARPLGQAGPAGSGFSNWSSHRIVAEAIPDGFGVSSFTLCTATLNKIPFLCRY